ncbi:hypothetical protein FACS1894163_10820 [Spirochaetia bacterium]|nr:hypothetical protein FACS1894163_10820 [Spirochaetia bacterium]
MLESEGVRHSYKNNECIEISKDIGEKITLVMELRIHYGGWLALVTCYRHKI